MYQKIIVATGEPLGEPAPLPAELQGLADETLRDLSPLRDQVPQYDGIGFVPVAEAPPVDYVTARTTTPFPDGYGTWQQQLEVLGEQGLDAFQAHTAAVKARFPKPEAGR